MKKLSLLIPFLLLTVFSHAQEEKLLSDQEVISLSEMGIKEANPVDCFRMLFKAHQRAIEEGKMVSYSGIDTLELDIPVDAKSIPLGRKTDFSNVVFKVSNTHRTGSFYLFDLTDKLDTLPLNAKEIDEGDFSRNSTLREGTHVLVITDLNPWSDRKGYGYVHYRKDILLVKEGRALNQVVMPYSNPQTNILVKHFIPKEKTVLQNLTVLRDSNSTLKVFCFRFQNIDSLEIKNIHVVTPQNAKLYGDAVFTINNVTNLLMSNIRIDSTYSLPDQFGYGFNINNTWNSVFENIYGVGKWGVFGTNNMSEVVLRNCEINRYDIHLYGKNISMIGCTFKNLYNQFCGVYGTVEFRGCSFSNSTPFVTGTSFNTYVPLKVKFDSCTIELSAERHEFLRMGNLDTTLNPRKELSLKYWPSVEMRNTTVIATKGVKELFLYQVYGKPQKNHKILTQGSSEIFFTLKKGEGVRRLPKYSTINKKVDLQQFENKD